VLEHCSITEAKRIGNSLRELLQGFRFGWNDKSFTIGVSIGLVPLMRARRDASCRIQRRRQLLLRREGEGQELCSWVLSSSEP
jgi:hypothetical protein